MARADANADALNAWVDRTDWIDNLAAVKQTRSNTSVCLKLSASAVSGLSEDEAPACRRKSPSFWRPKEWRLTSAPIAMLLRAFACGAAPLLKRLTWKR